MCRKTGLHYNWISPLKYRTRAANLRREGFAKCECVISAELNAGDTPGLARGQASASRSLVDDKSDNCGRAPKS